MKFLESLRKKVTWLGILFIIGFWLYLSWDQLVDWLMKLSFFATVYPPLEQMILEKTAVGMFLASLVGGLFFVFLPIEGLFAFFATSELPLAVTVTMLVLGNIIGLCLDYMFGRMLGERLIKKWLKEKYDRYKRWLDKISGALIVIGNTIFFPIQITSLIIGTTKYPFKKFLYYTLAGNILKVIFLVVVMYPRLQ